MNPNQDDTKQQGTDKSSSLPESSASGMEQNCSESLEPKDSSEDDATKIPRGLAGDKVRLKKAINYLRSDFSN